MTEGRARERHIVAMSGGGFSMEPDVPSLDDFVLGLARVAGARERHRICFIPTASGDAPLLAEVVTSSPAAGAYRVERVDGRVVETRLPSRHLGA